MDFNESELTKIMTATSGFFKKSARKKISSSLTNFKGKILEVQSLDAEEYDTALLKLINWATNKRQSALSSGASSYSNGDWAAAAACESWVQELMGGSQDSIQRVETLISKLIARE